MPRPNRYFPYNRNNQIPSPRYPETPNLARVSPSLPIIAETPLARPFQYMSPTYIRGMTSDGKALATKSVVQTPDGVLHVQMYVVRYPSEDIRLYPGTQSPSPSMPAQTDPMLSQWGFENEQVERKPSMSETSQDGRSIRSASEECAVVTDDEDAEGELDNQYGDSQWRAAILRQERMMAGMMVQRDTMRLAH